MGENTGYQFSTSVNEGVAEIIITGEVTINTIDRLHAEVISIVKRNNAKAVLCDVSCLKGHNDAFAAAYFRVRSIPPEVQKLPSAVVDVQENRAYISFYETTAANIGQSMKWFTDIESARNWLKGML